MLFRSFWYIPPQFFSLIPIIYGIRLKFRSTAQLPVLVNAIFWPKFAYFGCRGPISELRCHFFSRILIIKIRLKFWRSGHLNLSNMTKIDTKLLKSVKMVFALGRGGVFCTQINLKLKYNQSWAIYHFSRFLVCVCQ